MLCRICDNKLDKFEKQKEASTPTICNNILVLVGYHPESSMGYQFRRIDNN